VKVKINEYKTTKYSVSRETNDAIHCASIENGVSKTNKFRNHLCIDIKFIYDLSDVNALSRYQPFFDTPGCYKGVF